MAFKLKDLIINLLPQPGGAGACPTASAPTPAQAQFCPTASAIEPRFCPTASAIDPRFCPTASAIDPRALPVVYCPGHSAPVLLVPAGNFCPTASATGFCPTASAFIAGACPTASAPTIGAAAEGVQGAGFCPTASAGMESRGSLEGLSALKQQLQDALAQVEEQERTLAAAQLPQTLAEAEDLETKLREALEELQQHKRGLEK